MERSLVLIKPDAMHHRQGGAIISRLEKEGLKVVALKMLHVDRELAQKHYAIHMDKPFFADLVNYITSAPIMARMALTSSLVPGSLAKRSPFISEERLKACT